MSDEAATFRSMMKQRYDLPDDVFDAMFGSNTPVYQGLMPALPAPAAGAPDVADAPDVASDADPSAGQGTTSASRAQARPGAPAQPGGRGARILEGPHGAEVPGPPQRRPAGRPGKRLSTRPAADRARLARPAVAGSGIGTDP